MGTFSEGQLNYHILSEEYRGVELTTFNQVKDHSDPLGVNTQNDFNKLAIHDHKGTELSDHVNMDLNENNTSNTTEANSDESHQAHQTNHLHKTSDADVNMDDEREQESENDFPVMRRRRPPRGRWR